MYYHCDSDVVEDPELQNWIKDIAEEGFVDVPTFGLSNELKNKAELVTLLSVAIFTSTAQHAATNNGQVLHKHTHTHTRQARERASTHFY